MKTFFRVLVVVTVMCFFLGVTANSSKFSQVAELLTAHGIPRECADDMIYLPGCIKMLVWGSASLVLSAGLPLWEFLLFPILWRCMTKLKLLRKLGLGMMFILLYLMSCASFDVYGQVGPHVDKTFPCPMSHTHSDRYTGG